MFLSLDPGNASRATSQRAAEILTKVLVRRSRSNALAKDAPINVIWALQQRV
jgi:hypothetical protein